MRICSLRDIVGMKGKHSSPMKPVSCQAYVNSQQQLLVIRSNEPFQLIHKRFLKNIIVATCFCPTIGMLGGCGCDVMCDVTKCVQSSWFLVTVGSSLSVGLFGMGYFLDVHKLYYYILVQVSM